MSKYSVLKAFLHKQKLGEVPMTFGEIERVIGAKLPDSARTYRAWWSNNPANSVITKEWLEAGFKSEQVDMKRERVVFRRVGPHYATVESTRRNTPGFQEAPAGKRSPPRPGSKRGELVDHPAFGALKGTVTIPPGVDLTEPADPDWGKVYDE